MLKIRALHWIGTNLSAFRGKPRSVFSNSLHPESETMFFFRNLYPRKFCLMFVNFCLIGTILRNFLCHNCIFCQRTALSEVQFYICSAFPTVNCKNMLLAHFSSNDLPNFSCCQSTCSSSDSRDAFELNVKHEPPLSTTC